MIKSLAKQIFLKCVDLIPINKKKFYGIKYWEERARKYGRRSVLNIGHSEKEFDSVTKMQKDMLFPLLKEQLQGDEELILDFGCGPGRFTSELAALIQGRAIGSDPVKELIDLAPKTENVEYVLIENSIIPVKNESIDIVWICLVLGGITSDSGLNNSINEIKRILKKNGLIFLVENTSEKKDAYYWKFRSVETYQRLFYFANLKHLSDYFDMDERMSIMVGRKYV